MHIESVSINNFKGIENMELELKPGMNLLIGDNGVGKTSVLEAISIALAGYLSGITGVSAKNILQGDIRIGKKQMGGASSGIEYYLPVKIGCKMDIDGERFEWVRGRNEEGDRRKTIIDNREICKYAQKITNDLESVLPVLSFQSEARIWQTRRGDFGKELKKKLNDRRCGYIGCLDYSLDIKGIQEWCLKMEMAEYKQNAKVPEYENFKHIISVFMQKMNRFHTEPEIYFSRLWEEIAYKEENLDMPVSYLSAGYQSLLWMAMDIAYRMALLNPEEVGKTEQIPGIILIDEVDTHLHPKWQWNVIKALEETFPKMQFVLATHSPIVISSCKNEQLILITNHQEVVYLPEAYGYTVQDVLNFRQGSMEKPLEVKRLREEFERAMELEEYEAAEEVIRRMETALGLEHSDVRSAKAELEMERWIEEN